jgi:Cu/Ag efflux pump CusA
MRRREAILYAVIGCALLLPLTYVPVMVAWVTRVDNPPMAHIGPVDPKPRFITQVQFNWCMRLAPRIYEPLLRFHAGVFGWVDARGIVYGPLGAEKTALCFEREADIRSP